MAEEVGFEPTETCASHAFQACRFGRSRTPPKYKYRCLLRLLQAIAQDTNAEIGDIVAVFAFM